MSTTIPLEEFHARLHAQEVDRDDYAFQCPICGTVQSARSLIAAGAGTTFEEVERFLGFSCVGRWTRSGPARDGKPGGDKPGCDWTLGGLFQLHTLTVETPDGHKVPTFEPADRDAAQQLRRSMAVAGPA